MQKEQVHHHNAFPALLLLPLAKEPMAVWATEGVLPGLSGLSSGLSHLL